MSIEKAAQIAYRHETSADRVACARRHSQSPANVRLARRARETVAARLADNAARGVVKGVGRGAEGMAFAAKLDRLLRRWGL